jgi:serine/threonine-protein kinase HipA
MIELKCCPSTLENGYNTYSPRAKKNLFDGKDVSHIFHGLSPNMNSIEAKESIKNIGRISLSGVQPKFSVIVDEENRWLRFTHQGERGTYIMKPCPNSYHLLNREYCAANEHLTMQIASQVYGIETAANGLCFFGNDEAAYITRRFDISGETKLHQEDFASLLGYTKANGGSDYKYCNSSYEECATIIRSYVKAAPIDILRFFRMVLFNFISLNDDAHLKNFSLLNTGKEYRLSPAYDLINTSLHLIQPRIFALDNGLFHEGMNLSDTRTVKRTDFEEFGSRIGLPAKVVNREIEHFSAKSPLVDALIDRSFLSEDLKKQYKSSTDYRRVMLQE